MESEGRDLLGRSGVPPDAARVARIAEMRYVGQGHEVEATVPLGRLSSASLPEITAAFEDAYRALYHRLPQGVAIEALNWRVTVSGPPPTLAFGGAAGQSPSTGEVVKANRRAWFAEAGGWIDTPVYDRYALRPGASFGGPAIVEERESTAVIGPGASCRVDDGLTIVVQMP
jgi:N-methylhydantoinase A/oxoprolinase/acetone carboxylase beta subunit